MSSLKELNKILLGSMSNQVSVWVSSASNRSFILMDRRTPSRNSEMLEKSFTSMFPCCSRIHTGKRDIRFVSSNTMFSRLFRSKRTWVKSSTLASNSTMFASISRNSSWVAYWSNQGFRSFTKSLNFRSFENAFMDTSLWFSFNQGARSLLKEERPL